LISLSVQAGAMTEQATKDRHRLLAADLVAGVTVSVDGSTASSELGGRRVCHRIDAVEHGELPVEPAAAPPVTRG
jgi:hypothetical protein